MPKVAREPALAGQSLILTEKTTTVVVVLLMAQRVLATGKEKLSPARRCQGQAMEGPSAVL
jgi:hypothetical protein